MGFHTTLTVYDVDKLKAANLIKAFKEHVGIREMELNGTVYYVQLQNDISGDDSLEEADQEVQDAIRACVISEMSWSH